MKPINQARSRFSNIARLVFYETLPVICLTVVWVIALANSLESQIRQRLEPHENDPLYFIPANAHSQRVRGSVHFNPVAKLDEDRQ